MPKSIFNRIQQGYSWITVFTVLIIYYLSRIYQSSFILRFSVEMVSLVGLFLTIALGFTLLYVLSGNRLEFVKTKVNALLKHPYLYLSAYTLIQYIIYTPFTRTSRDVGKLGQTIEIMKERGLAYFFKHYTIMPWLGRQHPPFQALLAYPFPLDEMVTLKLTTVVLSVFTVLATFEIARMYLGSRQAMFSALLLTNIYLFMKMAVDGMIDSLTAFLFTLTVLFFLRASQSQQRNFKYTLAAGICAGLGLLTKYTFILGFPILISLSLLDRKRFSWSTLGAILLTSLVVMLPWLIYAYSTDILSTHLSIYGHRIIEGTRPSIINYVRDFLRSFGLHLLAIALLGLIQLIRTHQIRRQDIFLLFWAFFNFIFFILTPTKLARYSTPGTPAFAMIVTRYLSILAQDMDEREKYFLFGLVLGGSIIWANLLVTETLWGCCFRWSPVEEDLVLPPLL